VAARTDQEDRSAEFAHRQHEQVDPARQQDRRQQRQQDATEDLAHAGAGTSAASSSSRWICVIPLDANRMP
jgi:hypothetical protein